MMTTILFSAYNWVIGTVAVAAAGVGGYYLVLLIKQKGK